LQPVEHARAGSRIRFWQAAQVLGISQQGLTADRQPIRGKLDLRPKIGGFTVRIRERLEEIDREICHHGAVCFS